MGKILLGLAVFSGVIAFFGSFWHFCAMSAEKFEFDNELKELGKASLQAIAMAATTTRKAERRRHRAIYWMIRKDREGKAGKP